MKLPQRPQAHVLEDISTRFFESNIPLSWVIHKITPDYGIDLVINIFEENRTTPYELLIQLKSSEVSSSKNSEKVKLKLSTYNFLRNELHVVMIVKYVNELKEAFWILLVDIPEPNQENASFTVNISKANKLSSSNWADILTYIKSIVNHKLASGEELRNLRKHMNNK